jgi:hypothetical protein
MRAGDALNIMLPPASAERGGERVELDVLPSIITLLLRNASVACST